MASSSWQGWGGGAGEVNGKAVSAHRRRLSWEPVTSVRSLLAAPGPSAPETQGGAADRQTDRLRFATMAGSTQLW